MNKKKNQKNLLSVIWMFIISITVAITLLTPSKAISPFYDIMKEASILAKEAMDAIKEYKINNGIEISFDDKLSTGMIGTSTRTSITTTEGVLEAKRTTCNPNWAAVVVEMFGEANLKPGDEIGAIFSGSFPAMNICVMAAAQVYGLKTCFMAGVGASYYGANQVELTFFDMVEYLYQQGIFTNKIDYISLGGSNDIGNFKNTVQHQQEKQEILDRISNSDTTYIYEENFKENIDLRLNYFLDDVPNIKMFVNVGGTMVGFGKGLNAFSQSGFFAAKAPKHTTASLIASRDENMGLIECMRLKGVSVASFLNIKNLCEIYDIPYDPDVMPEIGTGLEYYRTSYSLIPPMIGIIISIGMLVYHFKQRNRNKLFYRENKK